MAALMRDHNIGPNQILLKARVCCCLQFQYRNLFQFKCEPANAARVQMIMKAGHGGNSGRFQRMQETAEVRSIPQFGSIPPFNYRRCLPSLCGPSNGAAAPLLERDACCMNKHRLPSQHHRCPTASTTNVGL